MMVFVVLLIGMVQCAFGGGHHGCHAQQVQVVQQQVAIPVAAIPVTTGYAVPLAQYQYSVDPNAFSTYSGYLYNGYKNAQRTQATQTTAATADAASTIQLDAETTNRIAQEVIRVLKESGAITMTDDSTGYSAPKSRPVGDEVPTSVIKTMLTKNCASCHTQGKNPGKGISLFAGTELLEDLPYARMLAAVKSTDESTRMPKPPAPAWSESEVALFEKWVQQQTAAEDEAVLP